MSQNSPEQKTQLIVGFCLLPLVITATAHCVPVLLPWLPVPVPGSVSVRVHLARNAATPWISVPFVLNLHVQTIEPITILTSWEISIVLCANNKIRTELVSGNQSHELRTRWGASVRQSSDVAIGRWRQARRAASGLAGEGRRFKSSISMNPRRSECRLFRCSCCGPKPPQFPFLR